MVNALLVKEFVIMIDIFHDCIFILGSSVIVWKQTHRIISAGSRLIRKDSRMKLVRTNTGGIGLRIDQVTQDDRGKYTFFN